MAGNKRITFNGGTEGRASCLRVQNKTRLGEMFCVTVLLNATTRHSLLTDISQVYCLETEDSASCTPGPRWGGGVYLSLPNERRSRVQFRASHQKCGTFKFSQACPTQVFG